MAGLTSSCPVAPIGVALVNDRTCPIVDAELEDFLANRSLQLTATTDPD